MQTQSSHSRSGHRLSPAQPSSVPAARAALTCERRHEVFEHSVAGGGCRSRDAGVTSDHLLGDAGGSFRDARDAAGAAGGALGGDGRAAGRDPHLLLLGDDAEVARRRRRLPGGRRDDHCRESGGGSVDSVTAHS